MNVETHLGEMGSTNIVSDTNTTSIGQGLLSINKHSSTIKAIYNTVLRNFYKVWCFVYSIIPSREQLRPSLSFESWKKWFHYVVMIAIFPHLKQIFSKLFPRRIDIPPPQVGVSPSEAHDNNLPS